MAVVWIPSMLRDLTRGVKTIEVDCETVGEVIDRLEELYPGVRVRLCEGEQLRPSLVIFVDGVAHRQNLRWRLTPVSEVQFVPVIAGGMVSRGKRPLRFHFPSFSLQRLLFALMYFGKPPWDTGISPPELMEHIHTHAPGRALDLGCGTGTNVLTLAQHGWQAAGVDFIPKAIQQAKRKARQAGLQVQFYLDDVTRLQGIRGPFDLVLDMGCFHSLAPASRGAYLQNLERLLAPGGTFLLYAFLREGSEPGDRGLTEAEIAAIANRLELVKRVNSTERGRIPSAWFTWRKR